LGNSKGNFIRRNVYFLLSLINSPDRRYLGVYFIAKAGRRFKPFALQFYCLQREIVIMKKEKMYMLNLEAFSNDKLFELWLLPAKQKKQIEAFPNQILKLLIKRNILREAK